MWINREVNIPEELIAAQQDGRLVVFAGAGVSMGPPASLPGFDVLADMIAQGTKKRRNLEPVDTYLGRLEDRGRGIRIQQAARSLLTPDASRGPTALHQAIVRLFGGSGNLRIVTTNFDPHFTTVVRSELGDDVDVFSAPALPLGNDFSGLVYLHGSVTRRERLVLADSDFGKAYLSSAWATRFLNEMFAKFVVLFIGYSHQDPVMRYLARAYGEEAQRYAMTREDKGDAEFWDFLGIKPVVFPRRGTPDDYGAQTDALVAWDERSRMGALDHERRIEQIASSIPPLETDLADYISSALRVPVLLRFLTKHAQGEQWLRWAEERGAFENLINASDGQDRFSKEIASWFAERFVLQDTQVGLDFVARHNMQLSASLWHAIAFKLMRESKNADALVIRSWVAILCETISPLWGTAALSHLMKDLAARQDDESVIALFRSLVAPRARPDRVWLAIDRERHATPQVRLEVTLAGTADELKTTWEGFLKPRLERHWSTLFATLVDCVGQADVATRLTGFADDNWDPLSFSREAIETHPQNVDGDSWEFLIDAIREIPDWLLANQLRSADSAIAQLAASPVPLLRRLAIHGLASHPKLSPNQALRTIEKNQWLYRIPLKHEVFRLIAVAFPRASSAAQRRFAAHSRRARVPGQERARKNAEIRSHVDYARYNVAVWLQRIAPDSKIATQNLAELQAKHTDFEPRDNPDFDRWSTGVHAVVPKSPTTVDDLLAMSAEDVRALLLSYDNKPERLGEPGRDGLLADIRKAVKTRFARGQSLANLLVETGDRRADWWDAVIGGWRDATPDSEQWIYLIGLFSAEERLLEIAPRAIVDLLESGIEDPTRISDALLTPAELIADNLIWGNDDPAALVTPDRVEWLTQAINHVGGRVALFWLRALARRRASFDGSWQSLPEDYKDRFARLADTESMAAQLGRVVVASQVHFVFSLDQRWTTDEVLPWFDWERDGLAAQQAWHGFLVWGQWNEALLERMLPYTVQCFSRLDTTLMDAEESLIRRLAGIAVFSSLDPWAEAGWLRHFVSMASPNSRTTWARHVGRDLDSITDEAASLLWNRWINSYLRARIEGIPAQLDGGEVEETAGWFAGLRGHFDALVDHVVQMPAPTELSSLLLYRLHESDTPEKQPQSCARLLAHLISRVEDLRYECGYVGGIARKALDAGADATLILRIAERMAELGCPTAQEIGERARLGARP